MQAYNGVLRLPRVNMDALMGASPFPVFRLMRPVAIPF